MPVSFAGPFPWDESTQGQVLGAFFYGYVVTQYPGGRLAEVYGGKWVMGIGILITSLFTLLTPIAAHTSIYLLYAVRIIEGLGEGTFGSIGGHSRRHAPHTAQSDAFLKRANMHMNGFVLSVL